MLLETIVPFMYVLAFTITLALCVVLPATVSVAVPRIATLPDTFAVPVTTRLPLIAAELDSANVLPFMVVT